MMCVYIEGIGLRAPGLDGWRDGMEVLAGKRAHEMRDLSVPPCDLLPPAERRRAVPAVKLALAVGSEAVAHAGCDARALTTVFAASTPDSATLHNILEVLATPAREVSPTRFQNSVHNAPSGYWSIANQSHQPSISLCGYDATGTAGLLEAAARVVVERCKIALVTYDLPLLEPLSTLRPIRRPFGAALILDSDRNERTLGALKLELRATEEQPSTLEDPGLEALRLDAPVARLLPLLAALARPGSSRIVLGHTGNDRVIVSVVTYPGGA